MDNTADRIDAVATLIEKKGLYPASFWEGASRDKPYLGGAVCILGGIILVEGIHQYDDEENAAWNAATVSSPGLAIRQYLKSEYGCDQSWDWIIPDFSDGHSQEEVVQALRNCADKYRSNH